MKKPSKCEIQINTVSFPLVVGFTFLWAIKCFLFTIINMSDTTSETHKASYIPRNMNLQASFTHSHIIPNL